MRLTRPAPSTAGGPLGVRLRLISPIPLLAAAVVGLGVVLGWRGEDLPAQLYRVARFRAHGLAIWDTQWFAGHWTLSYSVLFPALASVAGVATVTIATAALAALAFDRLAVTHLGSGARPAAVVFALGTAVQSAIGQLPFLVGEAVALCACWAASRNRWAAAGLLALAASLTSPLAGAFVMIAMAGWALAYRPTRASVGRLIRAGSVIVAAGAPIGISAVVFPGQGVMPYPTIDYVWEMVVAAFLFALAGRAHPALRSGLVVYAATATVSVLVPSALGGNIGRIQDVLAVPLAVGLLWPARRLGRRLILPLVAVPLILSQWGPAWGAITTNDDQPSAHQSYFNPLVAELTALTAAGPPGRVEVVPTKFHWESVYVAPTVALARGWERQLDVADNSLFYADAADLDDATYQSWLIDNGVRFVALANAPLDYSAAREARLVAAGVPTLRLVWHNVNWRLYQVHGSSGIVAAPAHLVSQQGDRLVISTPTAGPVLIRERYTPDWDLASGPGCVTSTPVTRPGYPNSGPWITVDTPRAERFTLQLSLGSHRDGCPNSA